MAKSTQLLSILARMHPVLWEILHPHEPSIVPGAFTKLSAASTELNPQPLPPGPPPDRLLLASVAVVRDIAFAAITAEAAGQDSGVRMINSAIDDWCGNGRPPIPIPWPGPWPFAYSLESAPKELDVAGARLVGALSFAAVASRMAPGRTRDAMAAGADKLMEAALGGATKEAAAGR